MRLAFYGSGSIAERHIDTIRRGGRLDVAWLVSRSAERAEAFATKKDIPRWTIDSLAPLQDDSVDAVVVAYPTFRHEELAVQAFAAGKHVVCEKPLADSAAVAERIAAAGARARKLLLVGQLRRFWPTYARMRAFAQSGEAGELVRATVDFQAQWDWSNRGWRITSPGGYLLDMHVHELDLLLWFFDASPRRVWAVGENRAEREGTVVLEFASGQASLTYGGRVSGRPYPVGARTAFQLLCTNGRLEAEATGEVTCDTYIGGTLLEQRRTPIGEEIRAGWDGMWSAFTAALSGEAPVPIPPEEAVRNVAVTMAAVDAMEKHQPAVLERSG